jgi:colanic acid biosynthesis glycosyl transferase WcaI
MNKRRILLIGGNYFPEPTGVGKYNGEMIKWLAEQGNDCTVVTTFPYYPHWKIQPPYEKSCFWFKSEKLFVSDTRSINVIRCPHYVPKVPAGITRLISEFSFFFTAYLVTLYLVFKKKFDYVITVAPPFEIGLLGIFYKLLRGGKFLYHIQDLQVDAARDLQMIKSKLVINIFLKIECFIIKNSDTVSTISLGMTEKIKDKCDKEVLFFPNWVDTKAFYPIANKAELKRSYGFNSTDTIILYAGAIGQKQGLEAILKTAKRLENVESFKFAICGSGPYKERLVNLKNEMNLKNVFFLPLQPAAKFNSFLNLADVHLVLQKAGAADLVLPSKLTTILSVGGVAIVTATEGTSLHNIMSSADMGILIEPEDQEALVAAISTIRDFEFKEKGRNARQYAETNLCSNQILDSYFSKVFAYKTLKNIRPINSDLQTRVESLG